MMKQPAKYLLIYASLLGLSIFLVTRLASANELDTNQVNSTQITSIEVVDSAEPAYSETTEAAENLFSEAELDQLLAPIALYPDTLLTHIFIASTRPLELLQAAQWRAQVSDLDSQTAVEQAEEKGWEPSVIALVAFPDLLNRLSQDLGWLQRLGDAFRAQEADLLTSVQSLRHKAQAHGNLNNNEYVQVVEEDKHIVIQPAEREVVYVPYYDTRVVYGSWWWPQHRPYFWARPHHYDWHYGFYWSPRVFVRTHFFDFAHVGWRHRHVRVNHYYRHHYPRHTYVRQHRNNRYVHWRHSYAPNRRAHRATVTRTRQYQDYRQVKRRLRSHEQHINSAYVQSNRTRHTRKQAVQPNNHKARNSQLHQRAKTSYQKPNNQTLHAAKQKRQYTQPVKSNQRPVDRASVDRSGQQQKYVQKSPERRASHSHLSRSSSSRKSANTYARRPGNSSHTNNSRINNQTRSYAKNTRSSGRTKTYER